jgi:hypothetical protein
MNGSSDTPINGTVLWQDQIIVRQVGTATATPTPRAKAIASEVQSNLLPLPGIGAISAKDKLL